jgi:hypothetical protein
MTRHQISNLKSRISGLVIGHWSLVIALLCAVAVVPLLRSESPCTHDGAFHYYRVAAMRHALQDSTQPQRSAFTRSLRSVFTRYLPDLAFGYGYPFFNYRAALSYYLALALHLTGLALPVAFNLLYALSIAGSALTMYLLARDLFGPRAGIVAAVAYAYAPYQFLDALLRANMPETVALPFLPLILWAFRRLALTGQRCWFLLSVGSLAALLLTHNISSLLFVPFFLAYLVVLWLVYGRGGRATTAGAWIAAGSAFALALGLTAFFLGPALLEQDYAQLHMSRVTRNNDFHYNFLGLAEMFAPPAPVDTSLMNPPMRVHLGLAQAILGGIGVVAGLVRWRDRERRATIIFLALATVVMLWMSTRTSLWLWEHVPLLPFVQVPWRLVGRAILPLSLLGGAAASAIPAPTQHGDKVGAATRNTEYAAHNTQPASRITFHVSRFTFHVSRVAYYVIVCALVLSALPSTYPPQGYCPSAAHPTISDVFGYEHQSGLVGVDPEGSYFPIWVKQRPKGSPLEEQYAAGGPVTRFDETALPAEASIVEADYGPNRARVAVETPARFRARYLAFYFPGWRAWVDGEPAEVTPTDPEGLITFDVPPGHHEVIVRFGSTPTRTAFVTISLLSLAALLVLAIRYPEFSNLQSPISNSKPSNSSLVVGHWPLTIVAILLLALKLLVVDRIETPFRRPALQPDGTLPGVEHPLNQPYADGLTLIGYDQERTAIPADGTLRVDLYWTAHTRPTARYQTVIHLVGPDGLRWSLPDTFRPRGYAKYSPTTTWRPGRYALDSHEIEPLAGAPPGTYDVVLTAFDHNTLAPLSTLDERGQPAAPALTLGEVTLTSPRGSATLDELGIRHRLDTSLGPITLLGADFDRDEAAPGDPILLTTFWRADDAAVGAKDLTAHLALLAPDGSAAAGYDLPPGVRWYPTSAWRAGDLWRGQHILHLPASLEGGDYTWQLSIQHQSTHLPPTLHIATPDRTFTPPLVAVETDTRLGNVATLLGANLKPETSNLKPGDSLTVTLVWRAEDTPSTSYHVFLHLLGPDGVLVAQSDGVPANWTRPTTGWLPGETIAGVHVLTIPGDAPVGDYILSAGLYVPGGERLTALDGTDAVRLITVTVQAQ